MNIARMSRAGAVVLVTAVMSSGCTWSGLNGLALPFTKGGGDDSIEITVELENAANLVANSEVKYDEVTVGSVRKIELRDWTATLTVGLEGDARIPADVTAKVAQKSLLGAEYLALSDPADGEVAAGGGLLSDQDVIPLERTGRFPETEEVLAAGSMLLNGGGLQQIRETAHELNDAFGGRAGDIKAFMRTTARFAARIDGQRDNIVATLAQLDKLSSTVVRDKGKIAHALEELPQGFELLDQDRAQLVDALAAVDAFGKVAKRVIGANKVDLQRNLELLRPVMDQLARNGEILARNADNMGYPFLVRPASNVMFGDYMNLITEIEVSAADISRDWLGGTPLDGLFNGLLGSPVGVADDLTGSLGGLLNDGLLGGTGTLLGGGSRGSGGTTPGGAGGSTSGSSGGSGLTDLVGGLLGGN